MAKPSLRVFAGGKMSDSDKLATLTEECKQLAESCRILEKYDSVADRRNHYLAYGRKLMEIRALFKTNVDQAFGNHMKEHGLKLHSDASTSDAIWMAGNWESLSSAIETCPAYHPTNVRQWYGEQQGTRKPSKRKAASLPTKSESNDSDEDDESEGDPFRIRNNGDMLTEAVNGLQLALIEAKTHSSHLLRKLDEKPSRYDYFKTKLDEILEDWKRVATNMRELEKRRR